MIVTWLVAVVFLLAGGAKLAGVSMMVAVFDQVGIGQWFRYAVGLIEVGSGLALLRPAITGYAAVLLAVTMAGAIASHLTRVSGSPIPAAILCVLSLLIAWSHKETLPNTFRKLTSSRVS